MKKNICWTLLLACSSPLASTPLDVRDAIELRSPQSAIEMSRVSPDGSVLAATVCGLEMTTENHGEEACDIWLYPLGSGVPKKVERTEGSYRSPAWSPDGRRLAFYAYVDGAIRLRILDISSGELRDVDEAAIDSHPHRPDAPFWISDNRVVVRVAAEKPSVSLDSPVLNGVLKDVSEDCLQREASEISRQCASAAEVTTSESGPSSRDDAASSAYLRRTTAIGEALFRGDFAIVNVDSGEVRALNVDAVTRQYALSPDRSKLAYVQIEPREREEFVSLGVYVVDLQKGSARKLAGSFYSTYFTTGLAWSPDSKHLAYTSLNVDNYVAPDVESGGYNEVANGSGIRTELHVVSTDGKLIVKGMIPDAVRSDKSYPLWSRSGDVVYLAVNTALWRAVLDGGQLTAIPVSERRRRFLTVGSDDRTIGAVANGKEILVRFSDHQTLREGFEAVDPLSGRSRLVYEASQMIGPIVRVVANDIVFPAEASDATPDFYKVNVNSGAARKLSTINPRLSEYRFGKSQLVRYRSADNQRIQAAVLLPPDYVEGKQYPAVFWGYGSKSLSEYGNAFGGAIGNAQFNLQMFVTRGYVVVIPDIPVNVGTPMRDIAKAVLPVIDVLVTRGIIDPDRIGVAGQSNGGYTALSLLVQSKRFKAAIVNAGIVDLTSYYGDNRSWLERNGGAMRVPPWEAPLRYVSNSPIYYLDRIDAPVLIQAGTRDEPHLKQSELLYAGLDRLHKRVRFLRFHGEGHVLMNPANIAHYWQNALELMDTYVKSASPVGATGS